MNLHQIDAFLNRYHNGSMVNYSPETGRQVTRHSDGWGSTLLVREHDLQNSQIQFTEFTNTTYF
jgi:hypothetical protein